MQTPPAAAHPLQEREKTQYQMDVTPWTMVLQVDGMDGIGYLQVEQGAKKI